MALHRGSKSRLNQHHLELFAGDTLFDRLARTVCEAECLPRKELYESWETVRRVRRRFRGGPVVDLAGGHGLAAWIMLLLDDSSPTALCIDRKIPASAAKLSAAMTKTWPRLQGRVRYVKNRIQGEEMPQGATLICVHGCGPLTDKVLDRAIEGGHRVAVLPCCHSRGLCDTGSLEPWMPVGLAVDSTRVARLREHGFTVWTATIPEEITPKNRLILAQPGQR